MRKYFFPITLYVIALLYNLMVRLIFHKALIQEDGSFVCGSIVLLALIQALWQLKYFVDKIERIQLSARNSPPQNEFNVLFVFCEVFFRKSGCMYGSIPPPPRLWQCWPWYVTRSESELCPWKFLWTCSLTITEVWGHAMFYYLLLGKVSIYLLLLRKYTEANSDNLYRFIRKGLLNDMTLRQPQCVSLLSTSKLGQRSTRWKFES